MQGISKSQMMGFCDAALGEDKVLVVHYLWQSAPYSYTIAERVSFSHCLLRRRIGSMTEFKIYI